VIHKFVRVTYLFAFRNGRRQRLNADSYAEFMPVLKISYIGSIETVEPDDHGIFECLTCFLAFYVISIPMEEIAHAVKLLRHASFFVVRETRVSRKELGYCIQILLGFLSLMLELIVTLYNNDKYK
jgi:hypothetical protein